MSLDLGGQNLCTALELELRGIIGMVTLIFRYKVQAHAATRQKVLRLESRKDDVNDSYLTYFASAISLHCASQEYSSTTGFGNEAHKSSSGKSWHNCCTSTSIVLSRLLNLCTSLPSTILEWQVQLVLPASGSCLQDSFSTSTRSTDIRLSVKDH